jgi:hypothetical protein
MSRPHQLLLLLHLNNHQFYNKWQIKPQQMANQAAVNAAGAAEAAVGGLGVAAAQVKGQASGR